MKKERIQLEMFKSQEEFIRNEWAVCSQITTTTSCRIQKADKQ